MANKKISELVSRTPSLTDLMLVGDPSSGYSYKCTVHDIANIIESDIGDAYVTLTTTQSISGAKTFSNVLTLTSVANSSVDTDKFLVLTASNTVNYRTGAEVLSDIGGASSSSISGTTNYVAKFTSSSAIGNSLIFDNGTNVGISTTSPSYKLDVNGTLRSTDSSYFATSSGNIGIGTNSVTGIGGPIMHIHAPTYPEIHLTNSTTGDQYQDGTSIHVSGSSLNILNYESGSINLSTSGTQRVSIASDGNITLSVIANATTDTDKFLVSDSGVIKYRTGAELLSDIGGASSTAISGTTNYIPKFTSATAIGNSVIYESSSNIGIGITSPSARLHVNGTGNFTGGVYMAEAYLSSPNSIVGIVDSTNANGGFLQFSTSSTVIAEMGASQSVIGSGGNDLFVINGKGARDLILATNATERVRIASTGAVTLSTIANATTDTDKFLVSDSGVIKYRTGAELLSDIGGASSSSVSGTTNYIPKFTSSSAIGNSVIYESSSNIGINTTSPSNILHLYKASEPEIYLQSSGATFRTGLNSDNEYFVYSANAKAIYFANNGSERMRLDASGNLGIGTSSPAYKLDVAGTGGFSGAITSSLSSGIFLDNSAGGTNATQIRIKNTGGDVRIGVESSAGQTIQLGTSPYAAVFGNQGNYPVQFTTNGTTRMTLDASGNLGLGVTPSAWSTNYRGLEVGAIGSGFMSKSGEANLYINANAYYDTGGTWRYGYTDLASAYQQIGGTHKWLTAPSGTAGNAISFTQAMTLDASGNLLLGTTTNPNSNRLRIVSSGTQTLRVENTATSGTAYAIIGDASGVGATNNRAIYAYASGGTNNVGLYIDDITAASGSYGIYNAASAQNYIKGNVGIGTTNPTRKLYVEDSDVWMAIKRTSNREYLLGLGTTDNFRIYDGTAGTDRMVITSGGNVGIGTTSPSQKLVVQESGDVFLQLRNNTAGQNFFIGALSTETRLNNDNTTPTTFWNNGSERMRITSGGSLLLGTTTDKTTIIGASGTGQTIGGSGTTNLAIWNTGNADWVYSIAVGNDGTVYNYNKGNTPMLFSTNATERMRITSGGNVLVNRTTTWSAFGDSGGAAILSDANGSALYAVYDGGESLGLSRRGSDGTIALFRRDATTVGTISVTGSATAYNTSSDYRLKQDLKTFNGLSLIDSINVYDYQWKSDSTRSYGVLAHELQSVMPYAVTGIKDGKDMQGVDYSKLVPVLIQAIKDLKAEIETLKNK